jgi:hypothetical protein
VQNIAVSKFFKKYLTIPDGFGLIQASIWGCEKTHVVEIVVLVCFQQFLAFSFKFLGYFYNLSGGGKENSRKLYILTAKGLRF